MGHDTLNKKISIPDLPRNPQVWGTPPADMLYNDHSIDPSMNDVRDEWLSNEIDSSPLISPEERDVTESRYGAELGKKAFDMSGMVDDDDTHDEEDIHKDHEDDE
jgi:hypothetical protein